MYKNTVAQAIKGLFLILVKKKPGGQGKKLRQLDKLSSKGQLCRIRAGVRCDSTEFSFILDETQYIILQKKP
jgi:hypothetical protein